MHRNAYDWKYWHWRAKVREGSTVNMLRLALGIGWKEVGSSGADN